MMPPPMKRQKRLKTAADFGAGELPESFEDMAFFTKVFMIMAHLPIREGRC
jgi:hypothetical protein